MNRCALVFGLFSVVAIPAPAFALREVIVGNQPLNGFSKEVLSAANVPERVFLSHHAEAGSLTMDYKGG
ncbi:MAG TPA: hypothetical protein VKD71_11485, partial [Gemmataceae bacterium]|nr:hypothetical protein [Gemmataceae bacterium]